jgi:hypothetical protein
MSAEMDSYTDKIRIYVPLLNEGTAVARPTFASLVAQGQYLVLPTEDYDPQDEAWEFPPGSIVRCREVSKGGQPVLIAFARVEP